MQNGFINMQNVDWKNNGYVRYGPILMQHDDERNAIASQCEEGGTKEHVWNERNVD